MLSELKGLHDELRAAIAELELQTAGAGPDEGRLPMVRLKLTRISGRRRCLIDNTIGPQLHDVSPEDARRMEDLRRAASDMAIESAEHIARWNMRAIAADWEGYRAASATMRSQMLRRIADESTVLYPLLEGRAA